MAWLLRNANISLLKRSFFHSDLLTRFCCKPGLLGTSQVLSFSTRKRRSKSDGSDSGEENMCKKDVALQQAIDQITSAYGKGSIMWLGRSVAPKNIPVVSTGSFALDIALGVGGLPKGRVVEIFGPEASGKTTLALHVIAEAQKLGGYCAFVDAEHALDKTLAESIGVNTKNLLLSQPDCGEQALGLVDTLIRSGSVDVIVVDSVAALVPKGELDGEMGDAHMAMQARLMSQALRKLCHSLSLSQCILVFINQVRSKISTFGGFGGPTEVTCGGNALKFYASVRLNIKRIGFVKKGEETLGSQVLVKVVKNKHAPPFKTAQFELEFGKGISREAEVIELSIKYKLVKKSGSFYEYNGQNFHGKDALKRFLADSDGIQELASKLREKILNTEPELDPEEEAMIGDLMEQMEEMVSVDSTDETAVAAVEA
ncbi:unnamed protein product [Sphenostylis stenocarpa]|uniref:Uncharacterized protein n=1 Tax=Sphenostylis stenocarpa TaxID=92480 RepID=A0AA86TFK9_9FABA|nr:unnamed protein product [Sphenostylis stenocarpa]